MGFFRYLLVIWLVCCPLNGLEGQFYLTGEPPASVRWEKIRTESFNVIFPTGMYEQANIFANRLEYYKKRTVDLSFDRNRRMPVVMQGFSVVSNGYVAWTPDRMEIVPVPPQDSYAQDWLSQLAVHEYRHVVQLHNLRNGFARGLSFATGQIATGITSAMVSPWLYEGDAVLQETRLTEAGRGRSADFEMPLRTLLATDQRTWSYDKAIFGSYRDFVPDHYQYGYQIAGYAQARYGKEIWARAIDYTGRNMFLVTPLLFYLKKNHGISRSQLYHQTMDSVRYLYNKGEELITYTDYSRVFTRESKSYANDILPQYTGLGHIVFLRKGIDRLDRLIMVDDSGQETVLKTPGITQGISLSASGSLLAWDEIVRDVRWAKRSYSEIRLMEMETGRTRSLTKRTRYFSPDISHDGSEIVVTETDLNGRHALVILDATTGAVTSKIPSPGNAEIQTPVWTERGHIIAVMVSGEGKSIAESDPATGRWEYLLSHTRYNIAEPLAFQNHVIFRSNYTGIVNLFALERKSGRIFQITSSRFGAFHPDVGQDSSRIVYSDYTDKGFVLAEIAIDTALWRIVQMEELHSGNWLSAGPDDLNDPGEDLLARSEYLYEAERYRKLWNAFRFHSWIPFYTNVQEETTWNDMQIKPGFMLFSQNNLETVTSTIAYIYANGSHILKPSLRWSGWYPVFEVSGQIGHYNGNSISGIGSEDFMSDFYPHNRYELKTYIPMIFNRGSWIKRLRPQLAWQHQDGVFGTEENGFNGLDYLHSKLYLAVYKRLSYRDLYPRMGLELNVTGTFTPLNRKQLGDMYSISSSLYLPGIGTHHHLYLYAGWQHQVTGIYYLPISQISFPRGYPSKISGTFASMAVNYAFPLMYPDWSISSLLYIKRFRANLFLDVGYGTDILRRTAEGSERYTEDVTSIGTEVMADFHALRFIFPFSAGIRTGYLLSGEKMFTAFLFSIQTNL